MNKIDEAINIVLSALALGFAITTIIGVILYIIHPLPSLEATLLLTSAFACSLHRCSNPIPCCSEGQR